MRRFFSWRHVHHTKRPIPVAEHRQRTTLYGSFYGFFLANFRFTVDTGCGKCYYNVRHLNGEVSERFMELVLKTSDSQEPRVRIPSSPPFVFRS